KISVFDDIPCGRDFLEAVAEEKIDPKHDFVLMYSLDGAQLCRNKDSDCWMSIVVILNFSPDMRYKKMLIIPETVIPGLKPPKIVESCLFPQLHHIGAVNEHQREEGGDQRGLPMWN
ncbi:hypothetical protein BDV98DRAFT_489939, partial [Pterulicium gracile]